MTLSAVKGVAIIGARVDGGEAIVVERIGFRPRALLLWWSRQDAHGVASGNIGGIGVASDGAGQGAVGWHIDDLLGLEVVAGASDTAVVGFQGGSSPPLRASASGRSDGFTLHWDGAAEDTWYVHYLALGGAAIRCAAVRRVALVPGRRRVDLGFRPDLVVVAAARASSAGARRPEVAYGIGAAARGGRQAAVGVSAATGNGAATVWAAQRLGAVVAFPDPIRAGELGTHARAVSMDGDGFTLEGWAAEPQLAPEPVELACLALTGGCYAVGTHVSRGRPGSDVTRRLGLEPAALVVFSWGLASSADAKPVPRLSVGGVAGVGTDGCLSWTLRSHDSWPLEPRVRSTVGGLVEVVDTMSGELHAGAALAGTGRDGFTLDWTLADGIRREFAYVGFAAAVTRVPLRTRLARRLRGMLSRGLPLA